MEIGIVIALIAIMSGVIYGVGVLVEIKDILKDKLK